MMDNQIISEKATNRLSHSGQTQYSFTLIIVAGLFITCLLTANIISVKLIRVYGLILPAGVLIFPVSYIIGDVLTEVYGYGQARRIIWLGFSMNLIMVAAIWMGKIAPPASYWPYQASYEHILGYTPRLLTASFLAYLCGEFINAYILAKLKIVTAGRWLWIRTIGSTVVGQGIDSLIFITIAFTGIIPPIALGVAILTQWLAKSTVEALATPLTYIAVNFLKRHEHLDIYDRDTYFNPLRLNKNA